jgi:hypothetical protein
MNERLICKLAIGQLIALLMHLREVNYSLSESADERGDSYLRDYHFKVAQLHQLGIEQYYRIADDLNLSGVWH